MDDPRFTLPAAGAIAPTRTRNVACEAHALVRPGGPLFVGLEVRRIETTWIARGTSTAALERTFRSDHVNLAIGFEF